MEESTRNAYEASRNLKGKPFKSACYAPYASLYFHTNGDVVSCCKNTSYVLGNVGTDRLMDIWQGRRSKALRSALKNYNFKLGCEFCEWQIEGGQYDQVYAAQTFDDLPVAGEQAEWPSMMEFTASNTCNLACIMCYGELSSTIRAHREKLPPLPKVYDDRFFEDLRPFLRHLKSAKFFGGEPFLAQENYRIWDMMEADGVIIPITVTTNGTQWNSRVEHVLDTFPTHVAVSMDGVTKETVEKVRVNAHFETVRDNIDRFVDRMDKKKLTMSMTFCLMRQNWHEFGEYLKFAEKRDLLVWINTVVDPKDCSLYTLPPQEMLHVADELDRLDQKHGYARLKKNGECWRSAVAALRKNAREQQQEGIQEVRDAAAALKVKMRGDHVGEAWNLVGKGLFAEAVEEARKTPVHAGKNYDRAIVEGHALRRMGRFDEADEVLQGAIAQWRRSPRAYIEQAWLRYDQHRYEECLAAATEAERLCADGGARVEAASAAKVAAHALHFLGRKAEAIDKLRTIPVDHPLAFEAQLGMAWQLRDLGRFDESAAALQRAKELQPQAVWPWIEQGWLFIAQGRLEDALSAMAKASELAGPNHPDAEASIAHVSAIASDKLGRTEEALARMRRLVELRPGDAGAHGTLARMLQALGHRDEAVLTAKRALAIAADEREALAVLAAN